MELEVTDYDTCLPIYQVTFICGCNSVDSVTLSSKDQINGVFLKHVPIEPAFK
jgi:hypothetical protein